LTNSRERAQHHTVKGDEQAVLSLRQLGAPHNWRVELSPGAMRFLGPSPEAGAGSLVEKLEGDVLRRALTLTHSIAAKPLLAVRLPRGKLVLVLSEDDVKTMVAHVGRGAVTHAAVASHAIFDMLIGALIIMSSLGPNDPLEPTASSLKILWMAIGALAMGIGLGAKLRPHRVLLALDAVWMAALVANVIHDVVFGDYGVVWVLFVLILAPAAYGRLRMYSLLRGPSSTPRGARPPD
jgi:hypothetical protein